MQRAKRHHYIPQFIQRRFVNDQGQIWYTSKNKEGFFSEIKSLGTNACFWTKNLYTITEGTKLSDIVEREFYGGMEDRFSKILDAALGVFDRGNTPVLDDQALEFTRRVICAFLCRTPHFISYTEDANTGKSIVASVLQDPLTKDLSDNDLTFLRDLIDDDTKMKEMGRDLRVRTLVRNNSKRPELLDEFSIFWLRSRDKHSFILSSQLVYRLGNGGKTGLFNPKVELWLPLTPKIALVMTRDPSRRLPTVSDISASKMRQINEAIVANSISAGSHSFQLLNSLVG